MTAFVLTADQQTAYEQFVDFITDPTAPVFVLSGYSGTGKSTLVKTLLERLPGIIKVAKLIQPSLLDREVQLTATTNKACEALSAIANAPVRTIHSFLGLRVSKDYDTGITSLRPHDQRDVKHDYLLFIDEASQIDDYLLALIFKMTNHCKIVFMGDPAQLLAVNATTSPVFTAAYPEAKLCEVVRQAAGSPIIGLATKFRHTVNTGEFFKFVPDGVHIQHMNRFDYDQAIVDEFSREDWQHNDSKVLAWTNKTVIAYNHAINNVLKGIPHFQVGDYAVCNKYITLNRQSIKTDQTVLITDISEDVCEFGVLGNYIQVDHCLSTFMPKTRESKNALIEQFTAERAISHLAIVDTTWWDLRAAFACTINKAQGSTYHTAFLDLDDIGMCRDANQVARMLYVGASRASSTLIMTGDISL